MIARMHIHEILFTAVLMALAGCSTTGAASDRPGNVSGLVSGGDELLAPGDRSANQGSVPAPDSGQSSAQSAPPAPVADQELVCEYSIPTGSKLRKKVCKSASFAEEEEKAGRKMLDDLKRNSAVGTANL